MENDGQKCQIVQIIKKSKIIGAYEVNLTNIECPICLELYEMVDVHGAVIKLPDCSHDHFFHSRCAEQMLLNSGKCAICSRFYLIKHGNQPKSGTMSVTRGPSMLEGYQIYDVGTIIINYDFPDGIQTEDMPNPGRMYHGTRRTAYLPDDAEGNKVLDLLRRCFDIRQTFRIGTSVTTGMSDCVIWNGVHHKVSSAYFPNTSMPTLIKF